MRKHQTKTDNSYLYEKTKLRLNAISKISQPFVLELFAGKSQMWELAKKIRPEIYLHSIEYEKNKNKTAVEGDNLKFIDNLDLSPYNAIDLDAYGSPFKQLDKCFSNPTLSKDTVFICTDIKTMHGCQPKKLLEYASITNEMLKKVGSIFNNKSDNALDSYLFQSGIENYILYRPVHNKKYYYFTKK